jgi:hypothetical protein
VTALLDVLGPWCLEYGWVVDWTGGVVVLAGFVALVLAHVSWDRWPPAGS